MSPLTLVALLSLSQPWTAAPMEPVTATIEPLAFRGPSAGRVAVAQVGTEAVVVWVDERWLSSIFGMRVRADGTRVERTATLLVPSSLNGGVSVATDGTTVLVSWCEYRSVYAQRFTRDLVPIDPTPITVTTNPSLFYGYIVSGWDGQRWVLAYQETTGPQSTLALARIASSGVVTTSHQVLDSVLYATVPRLAFASTGRGAVLYESPTEQLYLRRFDPNGSLADASPVLVSSAAGARRQLGLVSKGNEFFATWSTNFRAQFSRFGLSGPSVDQPAVTLNASPATIEALFLGWSATGGYVGWRALSGPAAVQRLDVGAGQLGAPIALPAGTLLEGLDQPTGTLVLYSSTTASDAAGWDPALFSVRLDLTQQVLDATPVHQTVGAALQSRPGIGANDSLSLIAWTERSVDGVAKVVAARVDASGAVLDGQGLVLSRSATDGERTGIPPRVTWDGSQFVVAWVEQYAEVHVARVTAQGAVLDPLGGVVVLVPGNTPRRLFSASVNGTTLVCEEIGGCARFRSNGTVADPAPVFVTNHNPMHDLVVVGQGLVTAYFDGQLVVRTVELPGMTLGTPVGVTVMNVAGTVNLTPVDVGALVSWREGASTRLSTYTLASNSLSAPLTSPHFFGDSYAVLVGGGDHVVELERTFTAGRLGLTLQRFDLGGQALDATPLDVSAALPRDLAANYFEVAPSRVGWAITSTAFITRADTQNERVVVSRVALGAANGASCTTADTCGSGVCSTGVCCATSCAGSCTGGVCQVSDAGVGGGTGTGNDAGAGGGTGTGGGTGGGTGTGGGAGGGTGTGGGPGGGTGTGGGSGNDGGTSGPSLAITSTPPSTATCGQVLLYDVVATDGATVSWTTNVEQARITTTGAAQASFEWMPDSSEAGARVVEITASRDGAQVTQRFSITIDCPLLAPVGCSCSAFDAPSMVVLVAFVLLRRRAKSTRRS